MHLALSRFWFFALLTWQITLQANNLAAQARTTVILQWPLAPFTYGVVALLAISTFVQAIVTINAIRRAWAFDKPDTETYPIVTAIAAVLGAGVVALAIYGLVDFPGLSRWAGNHPGSTVGIAFAVMWIFMLGLMPLAALTGLIGIVGAALFIGFAPALSAFATETTGLLNNSQIATLPLFLMMGSFAAISGMADDLYRLAHVCSAVTAGIGVGDDWKLRRVRRAHGFLACDSGDHRASQSRKCANADTPRACYRRVRGGRHAWPAGSARLRSGLSFLRCSPKRRQANSLSPPLVRRFWRYCSIFSRL